MIRIPLPGTESAILFLPRWSGLPSLWQIALLTVLVLAPIALVYWLYRHELHLVRRRTASFLLTLRLALLSVLLFVIMFQPVLASFSSNTQKGLILVAVDRSQSMHVADPQPKGEARATTRTATIRRVLGPEGFDLTKLSQHHEVKLVGFDQTIWDAGNTRDLFQRTPTSSSHATNLDLPLTRALESSGRLKGVILLTDGQHNAGPSPNVKARELARAKVPIYPVALGSQAPDIALFAVTAPSNVFQEGNAIIESRFKVRGLTAQEIHIELWNKKSSKLEETKTIWHDGRNRLHAVRFETFLKEPGLHHYEVKVRPGDPSTREITEINNAMPAVIRVSKDKVRVLIVDGEARWEHHYLASALTRDRSIALDRVVFSQPRLGRIPEKELEKSGNAKLKLPAPDKDSDPLFNYDCIFLGDVAPDQLPPADRDRLARYVSERGGSLIIQAGKRFMPLDYLKQSNADADPLVKLLPIRAAELIKSISGFSLQLTQGASTATLMQLDSGPEQNRLRWAEFPNHYWAAAGKPQPGATTLAYGEDPDAPKTKEPEKTKGIIVQQNFGLGRVLYVGLESTWRWRFKVGDEHHHRFWGQVVRWAAADKLLPAGNQDIRFGGREPVYILGKPVEIAVRLGGNTKKLPRDGKANVQIIRLDAGKKETMVASVPLMPGPMQAHLLTAQINDLQAGRYRIKLELPHLEGKLPGPEKADGDTFAVVAPEHGEMIDLATNWELLESLANQTGGEVLTPETAHKLPDLLARDEVKLETRQDIKPWQDPPLVWITLGVLLTLLTAEWVVRKLAGLP